MYNFLLKTYHPDFTTDKPHCFILSRGNNTGKPLDTPCPNCFVLITESEEAREFYYWLAFGLWQSQTFIPHLIGSVIPFIRIKDLKSLLLFGQEKALRDRRTYLKSLALLQDFEKKSVALKQQLHVIKQVKKAIMFKILFD